MTKATDHTALPWMLHDMEDATVVTREKPGQFIAWCEATSQPMAKSVANAALIVRSVNAAPALAEALDNLRKAANAGWVMIPLEQPEHRQLREAAEAAREALASWRAN